MFSLINFSFPLAAYPKRADTVSPVLYSPEVRHTVSFFLKRVSFTHFSDSMSVSVRGVVVIVGGFLGTEIPIEISSHQNNVSLAVPDV